MTPSEPQPHDESYKRFFSVPAMVWELLEGFVPGRWLDQLDRDSLEPVPTSFISDTTVQRHSDVIWKIRSRRDGKWVYFYLLVELQSEPDSSGRSRSGWSRFFDPVSPR